MADCPFVTEKPEGERQRCECTLCGADFCTDCFRPYHYRSNCDDLVALTREWLKWRREGREAYVRQMAANDAVYQVRV
jgi:hypothetical protein